MMDNKTCSVDILSVSLGEEGYLIIPRQTRELCEPLVRQEQDRRAVGRADGPGRAIRSSTGDPGV